MVTELDSFYKYLNGISNRGVKPNLDRINAALPLLGNPQDKFKTIHIAGTNGKGTVCHFLSHLLAASGYKVGLTLSPHVHDYRERIQASDSGVMKLISDLDLMKTHSHLLAKLPECHELTYFEWGILLALQYFADQKVDFVILETGLGGRWDATNCTESILSGITTIGLDHMEYLGDTLEDILQEKLQIVKRNSECLFGPDQEGLVDLARKHCGGQGSRIRLLGEFEEAVEGVVCEGRGEREEGGREKEEGRRGKTVQGSRFKVQGWERGEGDFEKSYLRDNLVFALALGKILEEKGYDLDYSKFLKSLSVPPARLEIIYENPRVLLDGAHNGDGLLALKRYLRVAYQDNYDLVFGCLANRSFLQLAGIIRSKHQNYWAQFDGDDRTTPRDVYEKARQQYGGEVVQLNANFKERLLQKKIKRPIVVCGSFYLCSQFHQLFQVAKKNHSRSVA